MQKVMTSSNAFISLSHTAILRNPCSSFEKSISPIKRVRTSRRSIIQGCQSESKADSSESANEKGKELGFVGSKMIGIAFTCDANECGTRISKKIKRRSYERGTVVIQCPTCEKYHIIADNIGAYRQLTGGARNVEEIAENQGQKVTRVDSSSFDMSIFDDEDEKK